MDLFTEHIDRRSAHGRIVTFKFVAIAAMLAPMVTGSCVPPARYRAPKRQDLGAEIARKMGQPGGPGRAPERVQNLIAADDFDGAISVATSHLVRSPNDARVLVLRGIAYQLRKDFDLAEVDLSRAISLDEKNAEAYAWRGLNTSAAHPWKGLNASSGKNVQRTIEDLTEAIRRGKETVSLFKQASGERWELNLHHERGREYMKLGNCDLALQDFDRAIAMTPENATYYLDRGYAHLYLRQWDKAFADAQTGGGLLRGFTPAFTLMGLVRFYEGSYDEALRHHERAIEIEKQRMGADDSAVRYLYGYRALALWFNGSHSAAIEDMKQAISAGHPNAHDYLHLGYFMHEQGQSDQARVYVRRALEVDPALLENRRWLEPVYTYHPTSRAFFERETALAAQYSADAAAPATGGTQPAPLTSESIEIESVKVVPARVAAGSPFDIQLSYRANDPAAGSAKIPVMFRFEIKQGTETLFSSDPASIQADNGRTSSWVQHMNPTHSGGEYAVKVVLKYKERSAEGSASFTIE